jgi:hypothetical protein
MQSAACGLCLNLLICLARPLNLGLNDKPIGGILLRREAFNQTYPG